MTFLLFPVFADIKYNNKSGWAGPHSSSKFSKFQFDTCFQQVFNSQVMYLISFTKIFRSKKSSIQDLSLPKKSWVLTNLGCKKLWVTDFEKLTMKKQFGSINILDPKNFQTLLDLSQLDLICPDLIWLDPNWLNLS